MNISHGNSNPPIIGIACGFVDGRHCVPATYTAAVRASGALPLLLPSPDPDRDDVEGVARRSLELCDGLVLIGGDDPRTEHHGAPTHAETTIEPARRQAFDEALLKISMEQASDMPMLGVCLGMQLMALCAGGSLIQHMPEEIPTHADHAADNRHPVNPESGANLALSGEVTSKHHQAVRSPGSMQTICRAHDGVIEAIVDPDRPFYLGVQWHPERSGDGPLGLGIYERLVEASAAFYRARAVKQIR